jgi:hypothetical protein
MPEILRSGQCWGVVCLSGYPTGICEESVSIQRITSGKDIDTLLQTSSMYSMVLHIRSLVRGWPLTMARSAR